MQKQYDPQILKRLQNAELSILKDFDKVCAKYGINYFLIGGSLIGLVRHKGFIPWDDDLDIGMLREEYERFLKIMPKELTKDYILASPETHPGYCSAVIKLMRKGTKFVPSFSTEMQCELGIHIDIFIWDNLCDNKFGAWIQIKKSRILSQLIFLCGSSKPNIGYEKKLRILLQFVCKALHFFLNKIPNSVNILFKYFEKNSQKYNKIDTKHIVCFQDTKILNTKYTKDALIPYSRKTFEGFLAPVADNYKEELQMYYGDYMKLPPIEDRVNHCAEQMDFGDIY